MSQKFNGRKVICVQDGDIGELHGEVRCSRFSQIGPRRVHPEATDCYIRYIRYTCTRTTHSCTHSCKNNHLTQSKYIGYIGYNNLLFLSRVAVASRWILSIGFQNPSLPCSHHFRVNPPEHADVYLVCSSLFLSSNASKTVFKSSKSHDPPKNHKIIPVSSVGHRYLV